MTQNYVKLRKGLKCVVMEVENIHNLSPDQKSSSILQKKQHASDCVLQPPRVPQSYGDLRSFDDEPCRPTMITRPNDLDRSAS